METLRKNLEQMPGNKNTETKMQNAFAEQTGHG